MIVRKLVFPSWYAAAHFQTDLRTCFPWSSNACSSRFQLKYSRIPKSHYSTRYKFYVPDRRYNIITLGVSNAIVFVNWNQDLTGCTYLVVLFLSVSSLCACLVHASMHTNETPVNCEIDWINCSLLICFLSFSFCTFCEYESINCRLHWKTGKKIHLVAAAAAAAGLLTDFSCIRTYL